MPGDIHARLAALPAFPTLTGARVRLREPRNDDVDGVFALFGDPTAMRYWSSAPMRSRMQAEGRLEDMQAAFARGEALDWIIADRRGDRAMGTCTLFRFDARHRRAEVGYALGTAHWGKGLASEAVRAALEWARHDWRKKLVVACHQADNHASGAVLIKAGFLYTGDVELKFSKARGAEAPVRWMVWLA